MVSLEYCAKEDSVDDEGSEERVLRWLSDTCHVRRQRSLRLLLVHQILYLHEAKTGALGEPGAFVSGGS